MTDLDEHEVIERLRDSCGFAADAVARMCRSVAMNAAPSPGDVLTLQRECRSASGSAGQLAHLQQNPSFLTIRDALEGIASMILRVAPGAGAKRGLFLSQLGRALEKLRAESVRMATAKPKSREDVLAEINLRRVKAAGNG